MSDVIDEIISKLPSNVLTILEKKEPEDASPKAFNHKLEDAIKDLENIRINRHIRDMQNKSKYLESKTLESTLNLLKYQKELEGLKELMKTTEKVQKNDKYDQMIHDMQEQLLSFKKGANDPNPFDLFEDVNKLHEEVTEFKNKISILQQKTKHYEGLPPNILEAKNKIAEMKEKIQEKDLKVEKNIFMNL